jgi:hypothetical protein
LSNTSLAADEVVSLHYLSATPNYDGQKGRLAEISSYAKGTLTVKTVTPLTFESNSVTLAPQQSITKFTFKDGSSDISVKTFGIAAPGLVQKGSATVGAVTGTLATPSADVYVALRNTSSSQQIYSFYIQDDDGNWYKGTKKATLTNGKNYTATVSMTKLANLTSPYTEGTVGVIDGLPAIVISGNKAAFDSCCLGDYKLISGLRMSQRNRASLFNYAERSGNYNEPVYAVRYFRMAANDVYAEFAGLTAGLINYGTYLFLGRIRRGDNYDENTGGSYSACSNVIARDMDSKST